MNRRHFSKTMLTALGASALPSGMIMAREGGAFNDQALPLINGSRVNAWLTEFSQFGRREDGGVDRVAFSDADVEGRRWVRSLMEEMGLEVRVDVAGNILGRWAGSNDSSHPLMLGSHIDSVPAGGNFDGPLGSLGALEVVKALQEAGLRTRHPLEVVIFVNEEGGKTGSRVMAGEVQDRELGLETASGFTIGEGIRRLGGDPSRLSEGRRSPGSVAGYLELHIEQGAILEREGITIGIVEGIVGIRRWTATIHGSANHAGTTPMDQRHDAMLGAARLVEAVNRVVTGIPGTQVGTVGRLTVSPGAPNVIPGEVVLSIEVRALEMTRIQEVI